MPMGNAERYRSGMSSDGGGFRSQAAGNKTYGGGRSMPNLGPVQDKLGYAKRDAEQKARRNLTLKRIQAGQGLKFSIM